MMLCVLSMIGILLLGVKPILSAESTIKIIAHRGASGTAPENTLASVSRAWKEGADAVEIDVYLTVDNRIVVIHDDSTKRTTGIDLKVRETASEELRKLDAGSWKGKEFAGEKIPFLEEVIATIPAKRRLFVEIKCGKEILPVLRQIITRSDKMSRIVIIGFDLETMAKAKELMPRIPAYWLGSAEEKQIQIVKEKGLDGLDVHYAGVTRDFAEAVKAAGQKLYVWTVNNPEEISSLVRLGVDGITTDHPGSAREWLGKL